MKGALDVCMNFIEQLINNAFLQSTDRIVQQDANVVTQFICSF